MNLYIFSTVPLEHDLAVAENGMAILNKAPKPHTKMICFPCLGKGVDKNGKTCWNCGGAKFKFLTNTPNVTRT